MESEEENLQYRLDEIATGDDGMCEATFVTYREFQEDETPIDDEEYYENASIVIPCMETDEGNLVYASEAQYWEGVTDGMREDLVWQPFGISVITDDQISATDPDSGEETTATPDSADADDPGNPDPIDVDNSAGPDPEVEAADVMLDEVISDEPNPATENNPDFAPMEPEPKNTPQAEESASTEETIESELKTASNPESTDEELMRIDMEPTPWAKTPPTHRCAIDVPLNSTSAYNDAFEQMKNPTAPDFNWLRNYFHSEGEPYKPEPGPEPNPDAEGEQYSTEGDQQEMPIQSDPEESPVQETQAAGEMTPPDESHSPDSPEEDPKDNDWDVPSGAGGSSGSEDDFDGGGGYEGSNGAGDEWGTPDGASGTGGVDTFGEMPSQGDPINSDGDDPWANDSDATGGASGAGEDFFNDMEQF